MVVTRTKSLRSTLHCVVKSEEATTKLLQLEHTDETEIVIHVNKLKEGWDVTNLKSFRCVRFRYSD